MVLSDHSAELSSTTYYRERERDRNSCGSAKLYHFPSFGKNDIWSPQAPFSVKTKKYLNHNYAEDTETYSTISPDDYSAMQALRKSGFSEKSMKQLELIQNTKVSLH